MLFDRIVCHLIVGIFKLRGLAKDEFLLCGGMYPWPSSHVLCLIDVSSVVFEGYCIQKRNTINRGIRAGKNVVGHFHNLSIMTPSHVVKIINILRKIIR